MTIYCACETPVMDVEHDAGCRRCGRPVDFSPTRGAILEQLGRQLASDTAPNSAAAEADYIAEESARLRDPEHGSDGS